MAIPTGRRLFRQSHDHAAGSGVQITRYHSCSDQSRRTRRIAALPSEILNRLNEVSFNAVLLKELRMIAVLRQVADPGDSEGAQWAGMRIHRIASDMLTELGASSKLNAEWEFFSLLPMRGEGLRKPFWIRMHRSRAPLHVGYRCLVGTDLTDGTSRHSCRSRAPDLARISGLERSSARSGCGDPGGRLRGDSLLAHWTQTFMGSAAQFIMQFFPIFLLGALFGKLMEDSGSVSAIAGFMTESLGPRRAVLSVVLAGAAVTYGGVSLFVAFFVLAPMAHALFRAAAIPRRLMPAAIVLGTSTFTMSALPGTPAIQNAISMPFFGTSPFAAPGLGVIASAVMLGFGLWWLTRAGLPRARRAKVMGQTETLPLMPPRTRSSANAQRRQVHSIRRRSAMAVKAMPLLPSHWPPYRSSLLSASIS